MGPKEVSRTGFPPANIASSCGFKYLLKKHGQIMPDLEVLPDDNQTINAVLFPS